MAGDTRKELGRRMMQADADMRERRGAVINALETVYVNARAAYGNMQKFATDKGDKALVAKIEKDPAAFGTMRGHVGSGNALSLQGLKDKGVAKEWASALPGLVEASLAAENRLINVQRAYHDMGPAEGMGGPKKEGPDFNGL